MNKGYFVSEAMMSLGKKYFAITNESWWGYIRMINFIKYRKCHLYRKARSYTNYAHPRGKNGKSWEKRKHFFVYKISRDSQ